MPMLAPRHHDSMLVKGWQTILKLSLRIIIKLFITLYCGKNKEMCGTKIINLFLLIIGFTCLGEKAFSQKIKKSNPIIYLEESLGGAFGSAGGFGLGLGLNYQAKQHLFTIRYVGTSRIRISIAAPIVPIPILKVKNSLEEVALLYGLRFIDGGEGYSFSLGASWNDYYQYFDRRGNVDQKNDTYFGVPFEANMKWFKGKKERFRIYGLIPVGKPTALGGSIGFKLFGNVSRHSYAGIGLSFGIGYHKVYQ